MIRNKYRVHKSREGITVTYKSKSDIYIEMNQKSVVNSGEIPNLLNILEFDSRKVVFDAKNYISIGEFLKKNMSVDNMYFIIEQTISTLNALEKKYLPSRQLVLNADEVFFDEENRRVCFIYEPYYSDQEALTSNNFWISLIDEYKSKDAGIVNQCIQLKQYLIEHQDNNVVYDYVTKNQVGVNTNKTTNLIMKPEVLNDDPGTSLFVTTEPETTLSKPIHKEKKNSVCIIRHKDGNRVQVLTDEFKIGKSSTCNYTVLGNGAISRCHVIILQKNHRVYVLDPNSTNGTYINGVILDKGKEYILNNGDTLQLADEEFDVEIN